MDERLVNLRPEILLEHVAWVRRLAGRLVVDAAQADDVAQQTFLRLLEREGAAVRHPRAWIATIVRSVVRRMTRAQERRERHEARALAPAGEAAASEVVARANLQRIVVEEVLALAEPYRSTILMRFFEEHEPRAVARRLGVPLETVRTRLKRGLALLRARLEERLGGKDEWLAALAPIAVLPADATIAAGAASAAGVAASAMGVLAMALKGKLLVAALVVVIGGAAAWRWIATRPDSAPASTNFHASASAAAPAIADAAAGIAKSDGTAEQNGATVASATRVPSRSDDSAADPLLLLVRCRSAGGESIQNTSLVLTAVDATSGDGPRRIDVRLQDAGLAIPGLRPGRWKLEIFGLTTQTLQRELTLTGQSHVWLLDVTMAAAPVVEVHIEDESGAPIQHPESLALGIAATRREVGPRLPLSGGDADVPIGHGQWFWDRTKEESGRLFLKEPLPAYVLVGYGGRRLDARWVEPGTSSVTLRVDRAALKQMTAKLRIRVVDAESGAPIANAKLKLSSHSGDHDFADSDDRGLVYRDVESPGLRKIHIEAAGHETIAAWVRLEAGETLDLGDVALSRAVSIHLTLVDERGPIDGGEIEVRNLDWYRPPSFRSLNESFASDEHGNIALPDLGRARYLIVPAWWHKERAVRRAVNPVVVDLRGAIPDRVECRLQSGVDVTILCDVPRDDDRIDDWAIEVRDASDVPVMGEGLGGMSDVVLAPGRYVARVYHESSVVKEQSFTVGSKPLTVAIAVDTPASPKSADVAIPSPDVKVDLRPWPEGDPQFGHVVWGRVADDHGPVADLQVVRVVAIADPPSQAYREAAVVGGWFAVPGLPAGSFEATVVRGAESRSDTRLEITESPLLQRHDLSLAAHATFEVRVAKDGGSPGASGSKLARFLSMSHVELRVGKEVAAADRFQEEAIAQVRMNEFDSLRWSVECSVPPPLWLTLIVNGEVVVTRRIEAIASCETLTLPADLATRGVCDWKVEIVDRDTQQPVVPKSVLDAAAATIRALGPKELDSHLVAHGELACSHTLTIRADGYEDFVKSAELTGGRMNDLGIFELVPKR